MTRSGSGRPVRRGLLFGGIAAFLWGTHSVAVQYLTSDLGGMQIGAMRLWIAAASLFCLLRLLGHPVTIAYRNPYFWLAAGSTVINYALFHLGLERTNAGTAMVLENTAPFFVLLFLFVFARPQVGVLDAVGTVIAGIGVALTVWHDLGIGGIRLRGDMLELGAGVSWAVFLFASSKAMLASNSTGERLNFLFGIFLVGGCALAPLALHGFVIPPARDVLPLMLLAVFATALAYYFWYEAAAALSTMTATLLFALSVAFTFVNAAIFLDQPVTPLGAVGAGLIVFAVFLTTLTGRAGRDEGG